MDAQEEVLSITSQRPSGVILGPRPGLVSWVGGLGPRKVPCTLLVLSGLTWLKCHCFVPGQITGSEASMSLNGVHRVPGMG